MYSTAAGRKFRSAVAVSAAADGGRRRPAAVSDKTTWVKLSVVWGFFTRRR